MLSLFVETWSVAKKTLARGTLFALAVLPVPLRTLLCRTVLSVEEWLYYPLSLWRAKWAGYVAGYPLLEHKDLFTAIHYTDSKDGLLYSIALKRKRGPRRLHHAYKGLHRVYDDRGMDRTEEIRPYLGPYMDCHGVVLTPAMFHTHLLVFYLNDGRMVEVEDHSPIHLNSL